MTPNGKQPLATVTLTLSLVDMKRLGIDLKDLSAKLQESVQPFLTTIYPDITIVNVAASAAYATFFSSAFFSSTLGEPKGADLEAIFQAYEKMPLTKEVMQKKTEEMSIKVAERKEYLRSASIRAEFPDEIVSNIMLGTRLKVTKINFEQNIVTLKLAE